MYLVESLKTWFRRIAVFLVIYMYILQIVTTMYSNAFDLFQWRWKGEGRRMIKYLALYVYEIFIG